MLSTVCRLQVSKAEALKVYSLVTSPSMLLSNELFTELLVRIALLVEPSTLMETMREGEVKAARSSTGAFEEPIAISGIAALLRQPSLPPVLPSHDVDPVVLRVTLFAQCLGLNDTTLVR